jgi:hypothetical protein
MIYNVPFVPGKRTPVTQCQIGSLIPEAASIQVKDTTHIERTFTSGFGGGTKIDFKGYTITGTITAYVKRSGLSPHAASNMPARFTTPLLKIWIGGYYVEGKAAIVDITVSGVTNTFTVIEIAFESDGEWTCFPNVLEVG